RQGALRRVPQRRADGHPAARGAVVILWRVAKKLYAYRELLGNLTRKEIRIRYKQSFLGIAWAIFVPVSMMLVFTFIFSKVAKVDPGKLPNSSRELPYAVFAYCGLLPWTFFSQSLSGCVTTLVTNRQLVTKVYFPREVFPLSKILAGMVDFAIASLVLVFLMVWFDIGVGTTILWVPVIFLAQVLFMLGCGLFLSMANLFYRDVQYVFQVGIQLWMFATAVIYPIPATVSDDSPVIGTLLRLNPMTPILDGYRDAIIHQRMPDFATAWPAFALIVVILYIGVWSFDRAQYLFAERI
ncbi:MAG: ABC transporter permease, partial [Phycisphaerales bacterium]|nr:ABC transporter permease [Phycisphaerales bacterium]